MQTRVNREAAITAFIQSFDSSFANRPGGSLRGVLTDCDFDLPRHCGFYPSTLNRIFDRGDKLDAAYREEPSHWMLTTLAIIGAAALAGCGADPNEPENSAALHSSPAAAGE